MAGVSSGMLKVMSKMIMDLPEKNVASVCKTLKLTESATFKKYASSHYTKGTLYREYLISIFSGPTGELSRIYHSIEGALFVGGCAPGIGIAFNLIDFCFCLVLANYIGAFVALISCFPIPGFKLVGKGLDKLIMKLLRNIKPADLFKFVKILGVRLEKIGFHSTQSYALIRQNLENLVVGLHNPFAEEIVKTLGKILDRFPTTAKKMSNAVSRSGEELLNNYSVRPRTLSNYTIIK